MALPTIGPNLLINGDFIASLANWNANVIGAFVATKGDLTVASRAYSAGIVGSHSILWSNPGPIGGATNRGGDFYQTFYTKTTGTTIGYKLNISAMIKVASVVSSYIAAPQWFYGARIYANSNQWVSGVGLWGSGDYFKGTATWTKMEITERIPSLALDPTNFLYHFNITSPVGVPGNLIGLTGNIEFANLSAKFVDGFEFNPLIKYPNYRGKLYSDMTQEFTIAVNTLSSPTTSLSDAQCIMQLLDSDSEIVISNTFNITTDNAINEFSLDVSDVAAGNYTLRVLCNKISTSTILTTDDFSVSISASSTKPTFYINSSRILVENEIPKFALGIYTYESSAAITGGYSSLLKTMQRLEDSPYKYILNYGNNSLVSADHATIFQEAINHGIKIIAGLDWTINATHKTIYPGINDYTGFCSFIDTYKSNAGLAGYYLRDENFSWWLDSQLKAEYEYLLTNDPNHFTVCSLGFENSINKFAKWMDVYTNFTYVDDNYDKTILDSYNNTILQDAQTNLRGCKTFWTARNAGYDDAAYPGGYISFDETRMYAMAYAAIIAGSKGLLWYNMYDSIENEGESAWFVIKRVGEHIQALESVILANDASILRSVTSDNANVKVLNKVLNGNTIILAVNLSGSSQTVNFYIGSDNLSLASIKNVSGINAAAKYDADPYLGLDIVEINPVTGIKTKISVSSPYFSITLDPYATKQYRILNPSSNENYGIYIKNNYTENTINVINDLIEDEDNSNPIEFPENINFEYAPSDLIYDINTKDDFLTFYNSVNNIASYRSATWTDYFYNVYDKYGNTDVRFGMSNPTYSNFNINKTEENTTFNKSLIYLPIDAYSVGTLSYQEIFSSIPDVRISTISNEIELTAHAYPIHVLNAGQNFIDKAINDLHNTLEFRDNYGTYVATTIPYYATNIPTNISFIEPVAYSDNVVINDVAYIIGGLKPYIQELYYGYDSFSEKSDFSNHAFSLTPTAINPDKNTLVSTSIPNFPGKGRFGAAVFAIGNKIYYGLGVVPTWMTALHLDPQKVPSGYAYDNTNEHLYAYPVEHACGRINNNEIYAFAGPDKIKKYIDGAWIDIIASHNHTIPTYTHVKNSLLEFHPSNYIIETNYDDATNKINFIKFDRTINNKITKELIASMSITQMYPAVGNSHIKVYDYTIPKELDIYINQDYDCTVATSIIKGFYSYTYPVSAIYYKRSDEETWYLGASFNPALTSGDWTITPDEQGTAFRTKDYQFKAIAANTAESYIATCETIAIDRIVPSVSIISNHITGNATCVGKYFTEYFYSMDNETSVAELYGNFIPSVAAVGSYLSFFIATNNYVEYSRLLKPGMESIKYKFTPSISTSGLYNLYIKAVDASTNSIATFTKVNACATSNLAIDNIPSLINWNIASIINYDSTVNDYLTVGNIYDDAQLNNVEYNFNSGVWSDSSLNFSADYKSATFSFNLLGNTGINTVNLKYYDTFLNTGTSVATYLYDIIVPDLQVESILNGLVIEDNLGYPERTNNFNPIVYVNSYDNYLVGTMFCSIDGGVYIPSKTYELTNASRIYQGWQAATTMSVDVTHYFTFGTSDLALNKATQSYYVKIQEPATYQATGAQVHRFESINI